MAAPPFPKLLIATHNAGKLREIRALLDPHGVEVVSAGDLGLPVPEETEDTFAGNALLKARAAAAASGLPSLSDDSGLEVFALGGDPGVHSADWAGEPRDFSRAMDEVLRRLSASGNADRSARFVSVLALVLPDGREQTFEGDVRGTIAEAQRGSRGFGYDPIFIADGDSETFGEIEPALKYAKSHRTRAFELFVPAVFG